MEHYSTSERATIVETYIENNFSIVKTQRELCRKFDSKSAPARQTIKRLHEKFVNTSDLRDKKRSQISRPKRSHENIERVRESIRQNPMASLRCRASELNITTSTLRRIISQIEGTCERTKVFLSSENQHKPQSCQTATTITQTESHS